MLAIAILAAGKGTRMKSSLPKVLQPLGGKSLIERVLANCNQFDCDRRFLIVGHQADAVKNKLSHISGFDYVLQKPQKGTGHAIQQLLPEMQSFEGELVVLNGDVPLLKPKTIEKLVNMHREAKADVTFLSANLKDPKGYGRVFADDKGRVSEIIEDKDCNKKQLQNCLTNAGIYCFNWKKLKEILPSLSSKNNQGEFYLTETIGILNIALHLEVENSNEIFGINDFDQLSKCENLLQNQIRNYWMMNGVKMIDPLSCTFSEECDFGKDVTIEPQTHFRGKCYIKDGSHIGPGSYIQNSTIGKHSKVIFSVLENSEIGNNVSIGPYAHLRPKSNIGNRCKIGNFVEIKNSTINHESKISHLSYVGDSDIGTNVNIGAGTITANFDGIQKHKTIIGNNSKTGANSVLVAPIILGEGVTVGAGSTLTKNVPDRSLALGRSKQLTKKNWKM